jgi:hypothetical protein
MRIRQLTIGAAALAFAACASNDPELVPAPGTLPAPNAGAHAMSEGVRLEIQGDAWEGMPADLGDNFTPVLVHVENNSANALRIRYNDFILRADDGTRFHALPPFRIDDTVTEPITDPLVYNRFLLAPYLSPFYPNWTIYSDPFLFDTVYFNRYHPSFQTINLPTGDMIQKALPEGVVEPGGRVSGFLYFEDPDDDVGRVTLTHELTTPMGTKFGQIQIPLLTR